MTRRRILLTSAGIYGLLAALGFGWAAFRGRPYLWRHPEPWLELSGLPSHLSSLALGLALGGLTIVFSRIAVRRFGWARNLHTAFRDVLADADWPTIFGLALTSSVGEEVFFRGALQPSLGWVLTSILFGVVHVPRDRRFLAWTLWAVVMGFALGAIHEATGSLLGPLLAHFWINYENLGFIASHDPSAAPSAAPRLVGRRERR